MKLSMQFVFKLTLAGLGLGLSFGTVPLQGQTIGNWGTSTTPTTTIGAIGVGTSAPGGWQEIEYCDDQQKGLIVTKTNLCPPILTYSPNLDGVIQFGPNP